MKVEQNAATRSQEQGLAAYQQEYERLFNWRDLWNQLSNSKRFKLATQNERIEEKAARANRLIKKLIADYDAEQVIAQSSAEADEVAREILDSFNIPEYRDAALHSCIASAICEAEQRGLDAAKDALTQIVNTHFAEEYYDGSSTGPAAIRALHKIAANALARLGGPKREK